MKKLILLAGILALAGCTGLKPLKPGVSSIHSGVTTNGAVEFRSEMKQPENPAQAATQNFERTSETELPLPAGTKLVERTPVRDETGQSVNKEKTIVLVEPTVQKTRTTEKAGTVVGAAQKDTAREIGAKLASLKGIVWVGVLLFVFGLASLFYPPLRAIIGSVTTSLAIAAGGVALMILPTLIVGNELLILGGVSLAVGLWFLAHRHGQLRGLVDGTKITAGDQAEPKAGA
jgi:hypothetical protein